MRVVIGADVKSGAGIPMHGAYAFAYTFGMPTMGGDPCITDNTPPVLVAPSQPMITLPGGSTGYTATLVFSEPVTGVDTIGVTTSAGSLIVSGSGTTYLATLSGLSDAQTYTVTVTTAIQDRCAWFLSSSYQLSITVEAPTGGGNIFSTSTAYPIVETGVDAPSGSGACLIAPSGVTGSVQTLTGTGLVIGDLDVRIESDHHWASDIEAWLRFMPAAGSGPVCAILVRDEFGGSWFVDHTFDDGAPSPSGSTASTGTFAPETPLSVFNGLNADGTWTLFANDDGNVITGSVTRWSLMVTP